MVSGPSPTPASDAIDGRRRRIPKGEVQRQGILDGFEKLLGEMPALDISVKDITEAAGIKRPNFYFYFESKDDVLGELVGRAWDAWVQTIGSYHRRAGEPHSDYFDRLFGQSYAAWVEHDQVMVAGVQATGYDDKVRARWTELVTGLNRHLSEQMGRDAEAGLISPLSDDHGAIVERLTDMIVMAFYKDRSLKPAEAESARMLASVKAIWLGSWGVADVR
ncbi:TetR/AcrR family transcriptional regulator [Dietzia sp. B32]|uniref:TetR/AcrR family transcriptional regulator n=1 Tax=Dietzia sp. B32 TaxID=2915130 RepID=UPI0021AE036C|nr:TetR/AcrR family transcriptional regulator [Dietzia sp. B32]UVE96337.1 TetR/AcrR family transcriptional regulator [Dietzia sp. B32]